MEKEALWAVDILLESLTYLKKDKLKGESFALVPWEGPAEGHVYHETQKKVETDFLPKKKKYADFSRLNQIEQVVISIYLNASVDRLLFSLYSMDLLY